MATTFDNIEQLNADIRENIGPNGAGRITGAILQNVLLSMTLTIDALKAEAAALSQESQERRDADATIRGLIETKQNIIADLEQIRAGALAGAAAYVKPAAGIPATDLAQAVQHALELAIERRRRQREGILEALYDVNRIGQRQLGINRA